MAQVDGAQVAACGREAEMAQSWKGSERDSTWRAAAPKACKPKWEREEREPAQMQAALPKLKHAGMQPSPAVLGRAEHGDVSIEQHALEAQGPQLPAALQA